MTSTTMADHSKEAVRAVMHSLTGRAAVERCIRAAGGEPPEDRSARTRAHLEAHGATVTDRGGVRWPVPQSPTLTEIFGGRAAVREARIRAEIDRQEMAARATEGGRG